MIPFLPWHYRHHNCSEAPVRSHLKNVYATLTMSIMAASAGAYVHLFTDILKVTIKLKLEK